MLQLWMRRRRLLGVCWLLLSSVCGLVLASDDHHDAIATNTTCRGMPMTMYMDGFHRWGYASKHQQCLVFLFPTWLLQEDYQFHGAMVWTFLLAIVVEGLNAGRALVHRQLATGYARWISLIALYMLQALLGYVIMFLTMNYAIELFGAVVVGLMVGNLVFFRYHTPALQLGPRSPPQSSSPPRSSQSSKATPLLLRHRRFPNEV